MAKMNSPLHRVIDARRWDGELLLGRLFILFHAAFLEAGFLPAAAADPASSGFLPEQVGATSSTLSLRYLVPLPQLLAAVTLRVCAYGRHVVFYVDTSSVSGAGGGVDPGRGAGSSNYLWACVDAVAAAPLLSGGLDDTARALRNDPMVSALWRDLPEGLSRRVLREICGGGALLGGTSFMSLPEDAKVEILARLGVGMDLKRLSATCRDLRRLVCDRDREFWKHIYDYNAVAAAAPAWQRPHIYLTLPIWDPFDNVADASPIWDPFDNGADAPPWLSWSSPILLPRTYGPPEMVLSATEYLARLVAAETAAEQSRGRAINCSVAFLVVVRWWSREAAPPRWGHQLAVGSLPMESSMMILWRGASLLCSAPIHGRGLVGANGASK